MEIQNVANSNQVDVGLNQVDVGLNRVDVGY